MRASYLLSAAALLTLCLFQGAAVAGHLSAVSASAAEPDQKPAVERVLVIGQRLGDLRRLLAGYTLRGTEGFVDGSAPDEEDHRTAFRWEVYYDPDGTLEAHFRRVGSRVPHAPMEELDYVERGTWTVENGNLCETIPGVGSGSTVCFELTRSQGTKIQLYYTSCGAMTRCYPGRLGPEGELFPGRVFTQ